MTRRRWVTIGALLALGATVAGAALPGCQETPVNVPVRTFERAQKVDVVCMQVWAPDPNLPGAEVAIPPRPTVQADCAPVPPGFDQSQAQALPYHLYALVTQTTRGEVAVVDLTGQYVVDLDHATPGINFLPVGNLPTDVAVSPGGQMTFVGSAEPNKFALYGLTNRDILGDSQGLPPNETRPVPRVTSWPVCALPEAPGAVVVVPHATGGAPGGDAGAPPSDGGAADADADAGAGAGGDGGGASPTTSGDDDYDVVVVVPGSDRTNAKLITLDPKPFLRGAGLDTTPGDAVVPGSLGKCPVKAAIELKADVSGAGWAPGPAWSDGVRWIDGGVDLSKDRPAAPSCGVPVPLPPSDGGADAAADAGDDAGDAGAPPPGDAGSDAGDDGGELPFPSVPSRTPEGTWVARDGARLYIADQGRPIIHVVDLSSGAPQELAPLVATSIVNPARTVTIGPIAVSPATRDYVRYLYAVDKKEGTLMVFDVTSDASPHVPLQRPHAELNPFQEPDRIQFSVPVATVAFARHDFQPKTNPPPTAALTGLVCNPNPNIGTTAPYKDPGGYYRYDAPGQEVGLGPFRLRGIFAFATLSNGEVVTIDVDDWDAPCRRPDPLTSPVSALAVPEPAATGPDDLDPYHVPQAAADKAVTTPVSLEPFFPVSAPNRPRSANLLRNDPQFGVHIPNLPSPPALFIGNASVATTGPNAAGNALMLPVVTPYPDPNLLSGNDSVDPDHTKRTSVDPNGVAVPATALPGVRFSYEDPQVQIDQDWTVTYEGAIPGFDGLAMTLAPTGGDYQSLTLADSGALFCRRGVEDARLGAERAQTAAAGFAALGLTPATDLARRAGDYIQITDDLLTPEDEYWKGANDCWDPSLDSPQKRYDVCTATYGSGEVQELSVQRDFPVLEAYDDHLVVGRFGYPAGQTPTVQNRQIVGPDASNAAFLKLARCCFHNQAHFKVRAGAEWVAVGASVGYLHHVTKDAATGACVQSCETREALLNARSPALPRPPASVAKTSLPDRNSPLAMRNPMFSYVVWNGVSAGPGGGDAPPPRDAQWRFSTRGQFVPQNVNLASSTTAVSPQSMLFIESLQQLAVVDGSSQGLVLIDLNLVTTAHAPYF